MEDIYGTSGSRFNEEILREIIQLAIRRVEIRIRSEGLPLRFSDDVEDALFERGTDYIEDTRKRLREGDLTLDRLASGCAQVLMGAIERKEGKGLLRSHVVTIDREDVVASMDDDCPVLFWC